jgi:predicted nucleic acid-binding protein
VTWCSKTGTPVPVVDASVVVDWVAPDADPEGAALRLLHQLADEGQSLQAPVLLHEEVAQALLTGVRRGRWSGAEADGAFSRLLELPVALHHDPALVAAAWELSRRYDEHPIDDLVYVALAERLALQLYTADKRLVARLAGRAGLVEVG